MTVLSAQTIKHRAIVKPCQPRTYHEPTRTTYGLSACGYDIRLAEAHKIHPGGFVLASAMEYFDMPADIVGIVHDKSTWARRGLAVQNTVIEPGWRGYLTLEITNHSDVEVELPVGTPIAQVLFHKLDQPTVIPYDGKYQDQESGPQEAR